MNLTQLIEHHIEHLKHRLNVMEKFMDDNRFVGADNIEPNINLVAFKAGMNSRIDELRYRIFDMEAMLHIAESDGEYSELEEIYMELFGESEEEEMGDEEFSEMMERMMKEKNGHWPIRMNVL